MNNSPFDSSTHQPERRFEPSPELQSGGDEPVLEVKTSAISDGLTRILLVVCVLFLGENWFAPVLRSPRYDLSFWVGVLLYGGLFVGIFGRGIVHWWREPSFYLRADDDGVTMRFNGRQHSTEWSEIASVEQKGRDEQGRAGNWYALRDEQDHVLMKWNRDWCCTTGASIKKGKLIIGRIRRELWRRGRLPGVPNDFSQL